MDTAQLVYIHYGDLSPILPCSSTPCFFLKKLVMTNFFSEPDAEKTRRLGRVCFYRIVPIFR